jgi:hypothetical protein
MQMDGGKVIDMADSCESLLRRRGEGELRSSKNPDLVIFTRSCFLANTMWIRKTVYGRQLLFCTPQDVFHV